MSFSISILKKISFVIKMSAIAVITIADSFILIFNMLLRPGRYKFYKHYRNWAKRLLTVSGIKLEIHGQKNLSDDISYIYISNHSSLFDIPVIFYGLNDNIRIMYKKELEKIPLFGWGLKVSTFICVDREDPKKAMSSLNEALNLIRENVSVILFPEGTRSKDGKVGEFKRGAFFLAIHSGKPIVPVSIIGSSKIMPVGTLNLNSGRVKVIIHEPITIPVELSKIEERKLLEQVRNTIISDIANN